MITAVHALVYADDPARARAFFRDVLRWPHVDAHGGWLIFRSGPSELGVHPTTAEGDEAKRPEASQHHEITLICDDLEATVAELESRGAEFSGGITEQGFGRTIVLRVPGASEMLVYEPQHPTAFELEPH